MTLKIGYLGPKGTFTKLAVDLVFDGTNKQGFETIPECIDAVDQGIIDVGVVPLENAIEGTVHLTVDYLVHQVRLPVIAELVVPIRQHLLVHPEFREAITDIEAIYSHSHAIAQCHQYIHQSIPHASLHFTSSTGSAAEMVSKSDKPVAAIGNRLAAEEFGLTICREDVHDYPNNHTRFAVLTKQNQAIAIQQPAETEKTTDRKSVV